MTGERWPAWLIAIALYPFGVGAMAVNVFFASLLGSYIGAPVASTTSSIVIGGLIAIPATYAFARHIRHLMDQADRAVARSGQ